MARVNVDPDELDRFAHELRRFSQDLREISIRLNGNFKRLSEYWHDQEYQKYAEEYQRTRNVLRKFIESSEQQATHLQNKANRIREYL